MEAVRAVLGRDREPGGARTRSRCPGRRTRWPRKQATDDAFTGLLLGLGAVALLVGGVGVANTMVISVLERRAEIGLRRSLGATRGQIRLQFLAESLLLSPSAALGGVLLGVVVTAGYARLQDWPTVVPPWATAGGVAATLLIGAIAGLYPAVRAARLSPTEALGGVAAHSRSWTRGCSACPRRPRSLYAVAVSRAISTIWVKVSSRSSAVVWSPVLMWSLTVSRVSARALKRAAIVYRAADSISTASTP